MYNKLPFHFIIIHNNPWFHFFKESMEACRNQVPVPRVVYNILTHLEKNFSLSFLEMLFSRINLHEYPHLMTILKGFRSGTRLLEYLLGYKIMPEVAMLKVWVGFQPRGIMHFECQVLWEDREHALSQVHREEQPPAPALQDKFLEDTFPSNLFYEVGESCSVYPTGWSLRRCSCRDSVWQKDEESQRGREMNRDGQ